jgi:hypothetical protein
MIDGDTDRIDWFALAGSNKQQYQKQRIFSHNSMQYMYWNGFKDLSNNKNCNVLKHRTIIVLGNKKQFTLF